MRTNGKLVELYHSLEDAVKKGNVETKILFFKNLKQVEPIAQPWIEIKKTIDKSISSYQEEISQLYQKFGVTSGDGGLRIPPEKMIEFKSEVRKAENENKDVLEKYKKDTEDFNAILEAKVSKSDLGKMKFITIDHKTNKIEDSINIEPMLEFGLIKI